jgi:hypothetical protein
MDNIKPRHSLNRTVSLHWVQNVLAVQAPTSFLPRDAGEDTGEGWNDLNYLNGWNSGEYRPIAIDPEGSTVPDRWL